MGPGTGFRVSDRLAARLLVLLCLIGAQATSADALDGRWVGHWDCDEKARQYFLLDIAGSSARFEHGLGAMTLAGTVDADDVDLDLVEWITPVSVGPNTVTGIGGAYNAAAGAMTGEVRATGAILCRADADGRVTPAPTLPRFIATRVGLVPEPRENRDGLLFQMTDVRSGRGLSASQCARYADFLQAGEVSVPIKNGVRLHTAVLDQDLMLDVLGRDLNGWAPTDVVRLNAIAGNCKRILTASGDSALVQQAAAIRVWKPAPLALDRSRQQERWLVAIASQYVDAIEPLERKAMRIDEGLFDVAAATASEPAADGLGGLWHGYYQCGRQELYLRLRLERADPQLEGTLETALGMEALALRNIMEVKASERADGQFEVKPTGWVHKPVGATPAGLQGTRNGDRFEGEITGRKDCTVFDGRRLVIETLPKNPEGLLFKVVGRNTSQLTLDDCRRLGKWLAGGHRRRVGMHLFNDLGLDQVAANAVLGKSNTTWEDEDTLRFGAISTFCAVQLRDSFEASDRELYERISDWSPTPFGAPKSNYTVDTWLWPDMIALVTTEARELAAAQRALLPGLPAQIGSIDEINAWLETLAGRKGRFQYLPGGEQLDHRDALVAGRLVVGERVAQALGATYADYPQTFDGFKAMAAKSDEQQRALKDKGVANAATTLERLYGEEAGRRGSKLVPEMMARHRPILEGELAHATYIRMPAVLTIDRDRNQLADYWQPPAGTPLREAYVAYLTLRDSTVSDMVQRSLLDLVEWIESLPTSQTANGRLDKFTRSTFRSASIPSKFDRLTSAIASKQALYDPQGFERPDIAASLLHGQWGEVSFRGLEVMAYMGAVMSSTRERCLAAVESLSLAEQFNLNAHYMATGLDARDRILRGEFESEGEQVRAIVLFLNMVLNRPGCQVDMFGNVTTVCTTEEEADRAIELLMTSPPGLMDARKLMADGCHATVKQFVENLAEFAGMRPHANAPKRVEIVQPWEFIAKKKLSPSSAMGQ